MDAIVIKACLNGSRARSENPGIPLTPAEVAAEARRCADAGASIVHFHARTPEGGWSYDATWYAEANRLVRRARAVLISHTTARQDRVPVVEVIRQLRETEGPPELASVNLGHMIGHERDGTQGPVRTTLVPNTYEDIRLTLEACAERGILPEPGIHSTGMLSTAVLLARDGHLRRGDYFLLELGGPYGSGGHEMPGTARNYLHLASELRAQFPDAIWVAHASGPAVFEVAATAIATGAHVRMGFEDWLFLPDGSPARSSADLVTWAVQVAAAHGRTPATPADARRLLQL